jgi:hypothetical protein
MDHGSKLNFGTVQKGVIFPPKIEMVVPSEKRLKMGTKITLLTQEKLQKLAWKHQFYDVLKGGCRTKMGIEGTHWTGASHPASGRFFHGACSECLVYVCT